MKAKQKQEENFEIDKEDLKLLMKIKQKQEQEKSIEELYFEDMLQENDIYSEKDIEMLLDDDSISKEELAFMAGYLAS
ncbi:MAG: hypothetical protein QW666_02790 [Candidatus Woesearchaeota archaeon]